ncbi:MAG: tRNA preQ1(34) S-adenosylmethionine ribosyltransferase-isomerase QueA [candidate division WOR-3 bacterium]|nr:MAG: tRNA preQ1(34) S-adenosylmethionine ribosyltransferase-isomerase QueA [candidate division WOR-3 bacterium]
MKLEDYRYELPTSLIAQYPLRDRADSRLMVVDRKTGRISHTIFRRIEDYLHGCDILVINNTRVFKARMFARKETGGKVEVLLVRPTSGRKWEAMISHAARVKKGQRLFLDQDTYATVEEKLEGARVLMTLNDEADKIIDRFGLVPLPQYIKRLPVPADEAAYQTTFAKNAGSIAAPTAGLHFTESILASIRGKGVAVSEITLHIGPGTFKPIRTAHVEEHTMDAEFYEITDDAVHRIEASDRIVAVGTSVCRALETYIRTGERNAWSRLFIYPGIKFRLVDSMLTNFHLPCSTPLLMVCAFAGRDLIFKAYEEAIGEKYRFLSYGDPMLIV